MSGIKLITLKAEWMANGFLGELNKELDLEHSYLKLRIRQDAAIAQRKVMDGFKKSVKKKPASLQIGDMIIFGDMKKWFKVVSAS